MKKGKKFFAFSLAETMIMLTILAIAVAATTPMISRKIINSGEAGSTISGFSHGRYEIYSKEIVTFGSDSYEVTSKDDNKGFGGIIPDAGASLNSILVYERLDDNAYREIMGENPKIAKLEHSKIKIKSTLYEQITDVKPYRDSKGEINFVEYMRNGVKGKYPVGGDIIVESSKVIYRKGTIETDADGNQTFIPSNDGNDILPTENQRIIEGILTQRCAKSKFRAGTTNPLWHANVIAGGTNNNFKGKVDVIPWEVTISGNKVIHDGPIKKDPVTGEQIGTFNPGKKAKNVVLHAVGGGGAGGGLDNLGKAVSPKTASAEELRQMQETLAKRFKEIYERKKVGDSPDARKVVCGDLTDAQCFAPSNIVGINYGGTYLNNHKSFNKNPDHHPLSKHWIVLNTGDGTISVRFDVRTGLVLPHELISYTKILGSQTQTSSLYDMPKWFDWGTIKSKFCVGGAACGTAGGPGPTLIWKNVPSSVWNIQCARDKYAGGAPKVGSFSLSNKCSYKKETRCVTYDDCTGGLTSTGSCKGFVTKEKCTDFYICLKNTCTCPTAYSGISHYYSSSTNTYTAACGGTCGSQNISIAPGMEKQNFIYKGGAGGAAPLCAVASKAISSEIINNEKHFMNVAGTKVQCVTNNDVKDGSHEGLPAVVNISMAGQNGYTCFVNIDDKTAISYGGMAGSGCIFNKEKVTVTSHNPDVFFSQALGFSSFKEIQMNIANQIGATLKSTSGFYDVSTAFTAYTALFVKPATVNYSYLFSDTMVCAGVNGGVCPDTQKGADGTKEDDRDTGCTDDGIGNKSGLYNHMYVWSIPYAQNKLVYGEAGQAGEYKSTKISQVTAPLKITLGKGGMWKNQNAPDASWLDSGKQGPNGTDTIVKMGGRTVVVAKGGRGGQHSLSTNMYNLCYAKAGECKRTQPDGTEDKIDCCENEIGLRTTKDIITTAGKMSAFENIKALVGNSTLVGIGLGRGGEGAGSRADTEEVYGKRISTNISYNTDGTKIMDEVTSDGTGHYDNIPLKPSERNFKGGEGAVIITW